MGGAVRAALGAWLVASAPLGAVAQQVDFDASSFKLGDSVSGDAPTAVLILDEERLFTQSAWGRRAQAEFDAAAAELQAENRKLEAELASEERSLADRRASMPADTFRTAADSFDQRVTGIRQAQEDKARALTNQRDAERRSFFTAAIPSLRELLRQRGASAIVDARAVLLSLNSVEATDAAVALVDSALGPGPAAAATAPQPAPQNAPQSAPQTAPQPTPQPAPAP